MSRADATYVVAARVIGAPYLRAASWSGSFPSCPKSVLRPW
jgi:hypothetical protein